MQDQPAPAHNFRLDAFFSSRGMRSDILKDTRLQPDHFSFQRDLSNALIARFEQQEPTFCKTYLKFIQIFEALRASLFAYRLSSSQAESIKDSSTQFVLDDGFRILSSVPLIPAVTAPGVVSDISLQNYRIFRTNDGNVHSGDDILEVAFDTLKVILDYCKFLEAQRSSEPNPNLDMLALFRLFNQLRFYKSDWYDCLLLGSEVDAPLTTLFDNALEIASCVGLARETSLRMQAYTFGGAKSVAVAKHAFVNGKLKLGRKSQRDFQKFRQTMIDQLAYPYLHKLISALTEDSPLFHTINTYLLLAFVARGNVHKFGAQLQVDAYKFDIISFRCFVAAFLSVSTELAETHLRELEFKPNQKEDIWYTPLLRVGAQYTMLIPMIAQANFERFVESLISNDKSINVGKGFERYIIDQTATAIKKARLPFRVQGPLTARGPNSTSEQIDLLILADRLLYIGEVKYDAFPADSLSILQHAVTMKEACIQAKRKADFLRDHWTTVGPQVSWPHTIDRVIPFSLTEKRYLNGFSYVDVPIVSLWDFEEFFGGTIEFNVIVGESGKVSSGRTERTFVNKESASADLETYLRTPARRTEFARRLQPREIVRDATPDVPVRYRKLEFELTNGSSRRDSS